MKISPLAGKLAKSSMLVNVPDLVTAYYVKTPDVSVPGQRVAFGTSGHRGSAFGSSFNEWHILAISQAICLYRAQQKIDGPLFLGMDTHALSVPAVASALEVLAANGVEVMLAEGDEYTPTPAISHAILAYNRRRKTGLADGIVITPSHNPPHDGGFKYNLPNGGPAMPVVTGWIEQKANAFLECNLRGVQRIPYEKALLSPTTHRHDFVDGYTSDLGNVIEMQIIRDSKISLGADPLGGAGVHYWGRIAERYGLNLTVVNEAVDPTFRFMTLDWDGQIRMDPSSPYAMQRLIGLKDKFEIAFACDTDHDRHGIVTRSAGLMPPNHYLSVAIEYLFQHRPNWRKDAAIGKTVVSTQMIDRVASKLDRKLYGVPVGFKWFVDGLFDGSLGFGGEESAGASFARRDGTVWTTDKDGIIPALLAAEITARMGRDPGEIYHDLTDEFGAPEYDRVEAPATPDQKRRLANLSPQQIKLTELAGERIQAVLTQAPGNGEPIGGLKVVAQRGWFAARPSGTEDIYKIYAESFLGTDHLRRILEEAQTLVNEALAAAPRKSTPAETTHSKREIMDKTQHAEVDPAPLMKLLASEDGTIREKARESLVALGKQAVCPLISALQTSTSTQTRWEAAKALGALVDRRSIPALVKALEDQDSDVAWLAAEALRPFKRRAWPALLQALIESEGRSGSLRQGAHNVLVHQNANGFKDALASLVEELQPAAVPESTVLAARQVLARTKETA